MLESGVLLDGKYKIIKQIGRGGMSWVYLAINERANKQWAVKEIRKEKTQELEPVRQCLVAEIDILRNLRHPNLPGIVDVIEQEEAFFMVMEYVEGMALDQVLERSGPIGQQEVILWAKQLCQVLIYLHSREPVIIYRDMKPSNIMLEPDGQVKLIDFGTAREYKACHANDTVCLGTAGYAAPEQYAGADMGQTDVRTDVYNLGATIHHLLTGISPSAHPFQFIPIRQSNPSLSGGLEQILQKCTQYDPKDRYQSVAELLYDLEHFEQMDKAWQKKQIQKLALIVCSVCMTVVLGFEAAWGYGSAKRQKGMEYEQNLRKATTVEAYYAAILTDPTRVEAYLGNDDWTGLIGFLIADERLTVEESSSLTRLKGGLEAQNRRGYTTTVDVLAQLKGADSLGYQLVCNEIGEAYLFYYEVGVEKDKYKTAASWFQYAGDVNPAAEIYCAIADCLQMIAKNRKSETYGTLSETYQTLWKQMEALLAKGREMDLDLKLRIWREVVHMIANHAEEFSKILTQTELQDMLEEIATESSQMKDSFLQDSVQKLILDIALAEEKIQSARR